MSAGAPVAATTPAQTAWRGEYVEIAGDGETWRFYRCLRCGGELTDPDNQEGYGPDCKKRRELDWRTTRRETLKADRQRFRVDRDPPQHAAPKPPPAKRSAKRRSKGKAKPKAQLKAPSNTYWWITAKFDSDCSNCRRRIKKGARVAFRAASGKKKKRVLCQLCVKGPTGPKRVVLSKDLRR